MSVGGGIIPVEPVRRPGARSAAVGPAAPAATLTCRGQLKGDAMSQYFNLGDETLWNPSNGASRMFQRQIALFEDELGIPSGIGPMENDECEIAPAAFEAFVHALLARRRRTNHTVLLALCEGFTVTVLVLAERAGIKVDPSQLEADPEGPFEDVQIFAVTARSALTESGARVNELREKVRELGRHMPR